MLTGSTHVALKPDDRVFFRPNQSEAVFLQFGDILLFDGAAITGTWPTFPISA
jgi:D-serine deaminase-like pyridoxal phosphate-dependent protein